MSLSTVDACKFVTTPQRRTGADAEDLVELARCVQKADEHLRSNVHNRLSVIVRQIQHLQDDARKILTEARRDHSLHHAQCSMQKRPGQVYHHYERLQGDGSTFLSMLSPAEWGKNSNNAYIGSYRLEYDLSWTPLEEVEQRARDSNLIDRILHTSAERALTEEAATEKNVNRSRESKK